jgi:hypothetical protein
MASAGLSGVTQQDLDTAKMLVNMGLSPEQQASVLFGINKAAGAVPKTMQGGYMVGSYDPNLHKIQHPGDLGLHADFGVGGSTSYSHTQGGQPVSPLVTNPGGIQSLSPPVGQPLGGLAGFGNLGNIQEVTSGTPNPGPAGQQIGVTPGLGNVSDLQLGSAGGQYSTMPYFINWAKVNDLSDATIQKLNEQDITFNVLGLLTAEDIIQLGLTLGQTRLLTKAIDTYSASINPVDSVTAGLSQLGIGGKHGNAQQPATTNALGATAVVSSDGLHPIFRPEIFLGLNDTGEQIEYLDIPKYASNIVSSNDNQEQTVCSTDGGDLVFKAKSSTKKVTLESVTPSQWMGANSRILYALLAKGDLNVTDIAQYLSYTVQVSQYAQCKDWQSVLKYDNEYRRLQAIYKFAWGSNIQHLSNIALVDKGKIGFKQQGNNKNQSQQKSPAEVCRLYNMGRCRFSPCKFRHVCNRCNGYHMVSEHEAKTGGTRTMAPNHQSNQWSQPNTGQWQNQSSSNGQQQGRDPSFVRNSSTQQSQGLSN